MNPKDIKSGDVVMLVERTICKAMFDENGILTLFSLYRRDQSEDDYGEVEDSAYIEVREIGKVDSYGQYSVDPIFLVPRGDGTERLQNKKLQPQLQPHQKLNEI